MPVDIVLDQRMPESCYRPTSHQNCVGVFGIHCSVLYVPSDLRTKLKTRLFQIAYPLQLNFWCLWLIGFIWIYFAFLMDYNVGLRLRLRLFNIQ